MAETVVGIFGTHEDARDGVEFLREEGFPARRISILAPDARENEGFAEEVGVRILEAGGTGLLAGGVLGGVAGWLVGTAGLLIPGVGVVIAAGPIAGAMVGAVGGASLGGVVGLLVGMGFPREAAEQYARELEAGRTLVVVHAGEEFALAQSALHRARAAGIHHYPDQVAAEAIAEHEREHARRVQSAGD
jgi:hypothetical protein